MNRSNAPISAIVVAMRTKLLGSGTVLVTGSTLVWAENLFTVVVPLRFTSTRTAKPSVRLVVSVGMVPAASENMLNANVLPDVELPLGEFNAGPNKLTLNDRLEPNLNP